MKIFNMPLNKTDVFSYWFVLLLAAFLLSFVHCLKAQENRGSNLVTADWLLKNLNDPDLLILDASPEKNFTENHIPGAINVNVYFFGVMETPVPVMEKLFQSAGISADKKIVIYDQGAAILAPRMFYSLYYHGFPKENLFILDGGFSKWNEGAFPVSNEIKEIPKGSFKVIERNEEVRVMLDEFLLASGDTKNNALIEALEPEWHYGATQFFDRGGHIPNALLFPVSDLFNPDKTFKSSGEIEKMLKYHGINPSQKILTHCGGGVAAAVPFFAIKFIMGYDNVKLFMESQMGWLKDERELPFWTYDKPGLLRNSQWVNTWGGAVMRRYGFTTVSIIDVREPAEYNSGHLPFSVNISGNIFKEHFSDPNRLVELLGRNGVNASHEAVIVSGKGITKESALAFVLLEELGQSRVSLFDESFEKFTTQGFKLEYDTIKTKPAAYTTSVANRVFLNEHTPESTFEDVYIASGESVPVKKITGKVINLNYRDFLTTTGEPKPAKDIWNLMSKGGIPRYSRIICYSDDPGEAAVNYFIFKLMGFPDVMILLTSD